MRLADLNPTRETFDGVLYVHMDCPGCMTRGCGYRVPSWTEEGVWPDVTVGGSLKASHHHPGHDKDGEMSVCSHFHIVKGEIQHCGDVPVPCALPH